MSKGNILFQSDSKLFTMEIYKAPSK